MGFLDATVTIGQEHGGIMSAFRRTSVRWRRVARGLIVIGRHIALYLVSRLRIGRAGPPRRATGAQQARATIEELGPTAIKLGQILSTRQDVLPPAWQH